MKRIFSILLITHLSTSIQAQSFHVSFGTIFTKSKAETPIINAKEDFSNSSFPFAFGGAYFIPKSKLSIQANYLKYTGFSNILMNQPYIPDFPYFIVNGYGFKGSIIRRLDFEAKYTITKPNKCFF